MPGCVGWHKPQIDVHVREHVEVVRELGLQLTAKTEEASLVPREGLAAITRFPSCSS